MSEKTGARKRVAIRADDIDKDLQAKCWIHISGGEEIPDEYEPHIRWSIAEVLNAAIEAGVVSPPCHVDRDTLGRLRKSPIGTVRVSPGKPVMSSQEHWKGQTE